MVTVGESLCLFEEVLSALLVEFLGNLGAHWQPGDVEVSIFRLLDPVSPLGALEAVGWPVPGIL